jgi:DNA processing protein
METMDTATRAYMLLNMIPSLTPRRAHELLAALGSVENVLTMPEAELARHAGGRLAAAIAALRSGTALDRERDIAASRGITVIGLHDAAYPALLKEIFDPPLLLYVLGEVSALEIERKIAVIGSRTASEYGLSAAQHFSKELASAGVCIVSGFARGIDTMAHTGALNAGGVTIAVMGCGLLNVYPPENALMIPDVIKRGCLVSEFPLSASPAADNFPRRNRVVSGLSDAVLVVEAGSRSGALITAHFAMDQGRDVFCLPGNAGEPGSKGTNALIKEGAYLVDSIGDMINPIGSVPMRGNEKE